MSCHERMQRLMEARGVSLNDLAEVCGCRPETVAKWLLGYGRGFSVGNMRAIQGAFFSDVPVSELIAEGRC